MTTNTIDAQINKLFETLNKQKDEVAAAEAIKKQPWKTNQSIPVGLTSPVNIGTASEAILLHTGAFLINKRSSVTEAAKLLGIDASDQYEGFSYDDWFDDLRKRLAIINLATKQKKLADLENRLNQIISPEQRRLLELEAITKQLTE